MHTWAILSIPLVRAVERCSGSHMTLIHTVELRGRMRHRHSPTLRAIPPYICFAADQSRERTVTFENRYRRVQTMNDRRD